ncbi:DUF6350 family protein [Ruicaihuangia caeni]|uniref:DUF6350 family protein n=1 Tax=Ruicaihuangia caeni TaxID=3042517 RepID=A0AAW6T6E6_9MICO|nr:DUF6350 family protein [Klugiella sp. YN-L-19]MDI2098641.1 DUF6350 family protein [Klugiella sp. YN-L-19]
MNRRFTMLLAAFETAVVVAVGVAIPLAVTTVLWGFHFQLALGWDVFWRAAVDLWLVGHGVDVLVRVDPELAASMGIAEGDAAFVVTIAALGFALLTVLLALRTGRRIAETPHRFIGESVALGTFALLSLLLTVSADFPAVSPSLWQGPLLPTVVFAIGLFIGSTRERLRNPAEQHGSSIRDWIDDWPPTVRDVAASALRTGAAAAAIVVGVAAVALGVQIVTHYAEIIRLYEAGQTGMLGGAVVTFAQLALLPNFVIWTAAWFIGPGFAIGAGSSVGPLGTALGPLPTVPVLGALPTGELEWGVLGLQVPVVAGFLAGALTVVTSRDRAPLMHLAGGAGAGIVAGLSLGLLAWASAGSAGPGRLATVGPDPLAVALWAALEIGVAAALGSLATGFARDRRRMSSEAVPLG